MASNSYQYGTSPRKIQPEYNPKRKKSNFDNTENKKIKKEQEKQRQIALKQDKIRHYKNIAVILSVFLILFAISYRNSLITEKFNQIQDKKQELSAIEKTNGQLEVSIEESLNLSNVEKSAKKMLGMQKLSNDQKVYVTLPKKDYTESTTKEVTEEQESNWFIKLINGILKKSI